MKPKEDDFKASMRRLQWVSVCVEVQFPMISFYIDDRCVHSSLLQGSFAATNDHESIVTVGRRNTSRKHMLAGELKNLKLVRTNLDGAELDDIDLFSAIPERPSGVQEGNDLSSLVFKGNSDAFLTMPGNKVPSWLNMGQFKIGFDIRLPENSSACIIQQVGSKKKKKKKKKKQKKKKEEKERKKERKLRGGGQTLNLCQCLNVLIPHSSSSSSCLLFVAVVGCRARRRGQRGCGA